MNTALESPKAPWNQPFNIAGIRNKTKKAAWWQLGNNNNTKYKRK